MKFSTKLKFEICKNIFNDFEDNLDETRFKRDEFKGFRKNKFLRILSDLKSLPAFLYQTQNYIHYDFLFQQVDKKSQNCLLKVAAYKIMKYRKVILPITKEYLQAISNLSKSLELEQKYIEHSFTFLPKFELCNLSSLSMGYDDLKLYGLIPGVVMMFVLEQYKDDYLNLKAEKDDYILDLGGFYGETALYFANKVGANGKVFSFEFIPNNLTNFEKNLELNPNLRKVIKVVDQPVGKENGEKLFCIDNGPGTIVKDKRTSDNDLEFNSITIDHFVNSNNLPKVNMIKMDIEGSELAALIGAKEVLKKYRPKLAISIYHKNEDPYEIPKFIDSLNLGYKFSVNQFYIFPEEVVLYAISHQ